MMTKEQVSRKKGGEKDRTRKKGRGRYDKEDED